MKRIVSIWQDFRLPFLRFELWALGLSLRRPFVGAWTVLIGMMGYWIACFAVILIPFLVVVLAAEVLLGSGTWPLPVILTPLALVSIPLVYHLVAEFFAIGSALNALQFGRKQRAIERIQTLQEQIERYRGS